jgi:Domain of Unknown Function (DUF1206)
MIYGFVTYGILKYAVGPGAPASSDKQSVDLTATALKYPGGQFAVTIVGAAIALVGVNLAYQAYQARFLRDLRMESASAVTRKTVTWIGEVAGMAPGQAKSVHSALRALADTPLGPWLLGLVAIGLVLFGAYSCCEALAPCLSSGQYRREYHWPNPGSS